MRFKKIGNKIIVRIDKGEEIVESLKVICKRNKVKLGKISGIGATDKVKIGFFDIEEKEYHPKEMDKCFEITSLLGNVSTKEDEVYLHLHINIEL